MTTVQTGDQTEQYIPPAGYQKFLRPILLHYSRPAGIAYSSGEWITCGGLDACNPAPQCDSRCSPIILVLRCHSKHIRSTAVRPYRHDFRTF